MSNSLLDLVTDATEAFQRGEYAQCLSILQSIPLDEVDPTDNEAAAHLVALRRLIDTTQAAIEIRIFFEAIIPAMHHAFENILEAVRQFADTLAPLATVVIERVTSWWRGLHPYTRACALRRVRYGERPVTGPPRRALFVAPVTRL